MSIRALRDVTGVSDSDLLDLLTGTTSTEALRNALADSKFDGIKSCLFPLKSDPSTQDPSTSDFEQNLTCLASTWQSANDIGSLTLALLRLVSPGESGVLGVGGDSVTGCEAINFWNLTSQTVGAFAGEPVQMDRLTTEPAEVGVNHNACGNWSGSQEMPGVKEALSSSSLEDELPPLME